MKEQSKVLTEFYREYYSWIESGANDNNLFTREKGLCSILISYTKFKSNAYSINAEMASQFKQAGLSSLFPFHISDELCFSEEVKLKVMHLNPKRIAWVKEHCYF